MDVYINIYMHVGGCVIYFMYLYINILYTLFEIILNLSFNTHTFIFPGCTWCKQHRPQELALPRSYSKSGDSFGVVVFFFSFFSKDHSHRAHS